MLSAVNVSTGLFLELMGSQCHLRNEFEEPTVFRNTRRHSSIVSGNLYGAQIGVSSKCKCAVNGYTAVDKELNLLKIERRKRVVK